MSDTPDAMLRRLREYANEVLSARDELGDGEPRSNELALAETFLDLDAHLRSGGEMPASWRPYEVKCLLPFVEEIDNHLWAGRHRYSVATIDGERRPADGELVIVGLCQLGYDHSGACDDDMLDPWFVPMTLAYYEWQEDPANAPF